jgi:hypothetical protein
MLGECLRFLPNTLRNKLLAKVAAAFNGAQAG